MMSPSERVQRGMKLLDEEFPGWETYVNPDKFYIESCTCCTLGQLGIRKFNLPSQKAYKGLCITLGLSRMLNATVDFGFSPSDIADGFALNDIWRSEIRKRKENVCDNGNVSSRQPVRV
jgi:hypothetical protein